MKRKHKVRLFPVQGRLALGGGWMETLCCSPGVHRAALAPPLIDVKLQIPHRMPQFCPLIQVPHSTTKLPQTQPLPAIQNKFNPTMALRK